MFAGIVEESAVVRSISSGEPPVRLEIESALDHSGTQLGDSICIDGVCLTVVKNVRNGERTVLSFDVALETLRRSTLGSLTAGQRVNLERSLVSGARVHGHFVFGHVDGTGTLRRRERDGNCDRLVISFPKELRPYIAQKGSISLCGTSLTVGEVSDDSFAVYIVPHTNEVTTLSQLKVGQTVNLEVDMLARYVVNALRVEGRAADDGLASALARAGMMGEGAR